MKARRTPSSNSVFRLPGGTEDNDLHVRRGVGLDTLVEDDPCAGDPYVASVWEPDPEERAALATGSNVELVILGVGVPPLLMRVTPEQPISRPQHGTEGNHQRIWMEIGRTTALEIVVAIDAVEKGAAGKEFDQAPETLAFREQLWGLVRQLDERIAAEGQSE